MFPLRDENPTEITPYFTLALIALNIIVWVYIQGGGFSEAALYDSICRYGLIPAELTGRAGDHPGVQIAPGVRCRLEGPMWATVVTSMFLHGSWLHLIGNMWFLWVFGNNIEDSMGHVRFVAFYLLTGLVATGVHVWTALDSVIPTIGASGAVSGVMGAYLVLYPRVRVQTLFFILIFIRILWVPAWVVLGQWFLLQFLYGLGAPATGGGIAFWAHIGGFVGGMLWIKPFENPRLVRAKRHKVRLKRREARDQEWW